MFANAEEIFRSLPEDYLQSWIPAHQDRFAEALASVGKWAEVISCLADVALACLTMLTAWCERKPPMWFFSKSVILFKIIFFVLKPTSPAFCHGFDKASLFLLRFAATMMSPDFSAIREDSKQCEWMGHCETMYSSYFCLKSCLMHVFWPLMMQWLVDTICAHSADSQKANGWLQGTVLRLWKDTVLKWKQDFLKRQPARTTHTAEWLAACKEGNICWVKKGLLQRAVHVNIRSASDGDSGLIIAVREGQLGVVKALIEIGGAKLEVNTINKKGESALAIAVALNKKHILGELLKVRHLALWAEYCKKLILEAIQADTFDLAVMLAENMEKRGVELIGVNLGHLRQAETWNKEVSSRKVTQNLKIHYKKKLKQYKDMMLTNSCSEGNHPFSTQKQQNCILVEELEELTTCSICFESMVGREIFGCSNNHCFCNSCLGPLQACPGCREDFGERPATRQRTVENLITVSDKLLRAYLEQTITKQELEKGGNKQMSWIHCNLL